MLSFWTETNRLHYQLRVELSRSELTASSELGGLKEEFDIFLMERWEAGHPTNL